MGIADGIKNITEEIVSSYENRINTIGTIVDNTHRILEEFKDDRTQMGTELKNTLAKEESLRRKDFDNMMKDVLSLQDEREKEVRDLLKTFLDEQKELAETIKRIMSNGEKMRIDDFRKMMGNIQARQEKREEEVKLMLTEFQNEYKEMAESLRSLLNKGEAIRIKDFKRTIKDIRLKQMEREEEVKKRLDEYRKERSDMASCWQKLTVTMAQRRAGKVKGGEGKKTGKV